MIYKSDDEDLHLHIEKIVFESDVSDGEDYCDIVYDSILEYKQNLNNSNRSFIILLNNDSGAIILRREDDTCAYKTFFIRDRIFTVTYQRWSEMRDFLTDDRISEEVMTDYLWLINIL